MKIYNQPVELIIDSPPVTAKSKASPDIKKQLEDAGIPVNKIRRSKQSSGVASKNMAGPISTGSAYIKTKIRDSEENPWDVAHRVHKAIKTHPFIEPDLLHEYIADSNADVPFKKVNGGPPHGNQLGFDPDWEPKQNIIWHLDDNYSQLRKARNRVKDIDFNVCIGHLDTGIDKGHDVLPDRIKNHPLQRNFVEGEPSGDAQDPFIDGGLRNPGHGLATMALLAGGKIKIDTDTGVFNEELGGAPFADVIPCRIASSVVLVKTSAFAEALNYLTALTLSGKPVHIVSMSMGGAPAKTWADAVNKAYEAGITIVTAAGNNFNGLPTRHVIYPARFKRVIAACGATYERKAYWTKKLGEMQGCYGPDQHMTRALAAFTPNTPWAKASTKNKISFSGAGTSSATPQVAAAAAIYYRQHYKKLNSLLPWQRVEAIRNALYTSALKKAGGEGDYKDFFGNGIIQASDALDQPVKFGAITPPDKVPFFPILGTLFKSPGQQASPKVQMLNTELSQLVFSYPELDALIGPEFSAVTANAWAEFTDAIIAHPASSLALKEYLIQSTSGIPVKITSGSRRSRAKVVSKKPPSKKKSTMKGNRSKK